MHMIDKHGFPKVHGADIDPKSSLTVLQLYDFFIVNDGIDRRTSMLRGPKTRRSNPVQKHAAEASKSSKGSENADTELTSLTQSMSALKFVPRNLKFGRGGSKAFGR